MYTYKNIYIYTVNVPTFCLHTCPSNPSGHHEPNVHSPADSPLRSWVGGRTSIGSETGYRSIGGVSGTPNWRIWNTYWCISFTLVAEQLGCRLKTAHSSFPIWG